MAYINRLHLAALKNGIIGNFFSIMWKSPLETHACRSSYIRCRNLKKKIAWALPPPAKTDIL